MRENLRDFSPYALPIWHNNPMTIICVEKSGNSKTGFVGATYRRVGESCPSTCSHLISKSCYAMTSFTGMTQRRANRSEFDGMIYYNFVKGLAENPRKAAKINNTIRLQVSGDLFYEDKPDELYITGIRKAHEDFPQMLGYTYTHRYTDFGEYDWPENLVVNASCDTVEDIKQAQALGWPTVTTTSADDTRKRWKQDGVDFVTCPAQTANLQCAQCRLCMKKDRKFTVVFRAHSSAKKKVVDVVNHIQGLEEMVMA